MRQPTPDQWAHVEAKCRHDATEQVRIAMTTAWNDGHPWPSKGIRAGFAVLVEYYAQMATETAKLRALVDQAESKRRQRWAWLRRLFFLRT
jgi:hypothetical protein